MASPHELFAQLRIEIFDAEGLNEFGRRLGYEKTHIYRLETGEARLLPKHVGLCHQLRVPSGRRAAFEAILKQLGEAVAAQELPRLQARKDKAREARRTRDRARKAAAGPLRSVWEPDPIFLQAWEAAVAYLAEVEAQADWNAAVEFLQAQADWTAAIEFLMAAELARLHLAEEAWRTDWAAAVEFLQAQAVWLSTVEIVIAAELVRRHRAEARYAPLWLQSLLRKPAPPALWISRYGSLAVALCTSLILLARPAAPFRDVYVFSQVPVAGEQLPRDMGQRKVRIHRMIPPKPFKTQKVSPCDESLGEVTINGGCWYGPRKTDGNGCAKNEYEDERGECYRWVEDSQLPASEIPTGGGTGYGGAAREKLEPMQPTAQPRYLAPPRPRSRTVRSWRRGS